MNVVLGQGEELNISFTQGERLIFEVQWEADLVLQDMTLRTSHMQVRGPSDEIYVDVSNDLSADGQIEHTDTGLLVTINGSATARIDEAAAKYDLFIFPDEVPLIFGKLLRRKAATHA